MGMISIRAIGAPTGSTAAVAGAYLDYLNSGIEMAGKVAATSIDGTVDYYDSGIEGPGMWHGHGARHLGLAGFVDGYDLSQILQGRHHETGQRLLSASGSSGRHSLKVGQATRQHDGHPVWSHHDLASYLNVTVDELHQIVDANSVQPLALDDGAYFTFNDVTSLTEIIGVSEQITKLGSIDDEQLLSAGASAKALGVSRRYINMVIANAQDYTAHNVASQDRHKDWLDAQRNNPDNPKSQWRIKGKDLRAFANRRQRPAVRLAYDATFTVEKSISVIGLLSTGATRDVFAQALTDANRTALNHLDQHASNGRERQQPIGSEGLIVASFSHATSRNNDPFLHVHNLIVNSVKDANGQGRALDARDLYLQGPTASALGSIELRWQLAQQLGLTFEVTSSAVEIAGVPVDVIDGFSTGRNRIESIVEEAGIDLNNPIARQHAATNSRPDKTPIAPDELHDQWWERAHELGFTGATLDRILTPSPAVVSPELSVEEHHKLLEHLASWQGATKDASIFTRSDVLRAIGEWSPDGQVRVMPAHVADAAATAFLTSRMVVALNIDKEQVAKLVGKVSPTLQQRDVFTTTKVLDTQHDIDSMWAKGLRGSHGYVDRVHLHDSLNKASSLTSQQRDLVTQWTSSGHQFQSAIGVPGSGKTYAMRAARDAWQAQGYRVIGASIAGTAAQQLGDDAAISSRTIASYIRDLDAGEVPFGARTVLVIDEAGTLPDRDLHALMAAAVEAGTTIRFLGDPAQHGSVEAGGMWHHLAEIYASNTAHLTESIRFKDSPIDIEVNELVRDGHIKDAFDMLRDAGQLTEVDSHHGALGALLRRGLDARDAGTAAPMIDQTNANRVMLNGAMQHVRAQRGEVTNLTQFGIRHYGIGDEIISKAPNRSLHPDGDANRHLLNGSRGVITGIDTSRHLTQVTADFGHGPITINGDLFGTSAFDLAYSLTSHSVQGATLPVANAKISAGVSNAELVVDLSRGQTNNHLIVVGDSDEELSSLYDRQEPKYLGDRIAQTISASDAIPAKAVDNHAGGRDVNLARLVAREAPESDVAFARNFHARNIEVNPPIQLVQQLPEPLDVPHLTHGHTNAIVNATLYQRTYLPYPNRTFPYGDVLGKRPSPTNENQQQVHAYDNAVNELAKSAERTTLRRIYDHDTEIPQWVNDHVADLAAQAKLTPNFDEDSFTQWAHAADHHLRTHGILPTATAPATLIDPAVRSQHDRLAQAHTNALNSVPRTAHLDREVTGLSPGPPANALRL